jgi:putative protease
MVLIVYILVLGNFNARAGANNFDLQELESAIDYAKLRNVKTYLTLNTLVKNDEFKEALALAEHAYNYGIDAILVQDLGLGLELLRLFPTLPIHASTQMTTHNLAGVLKLQELGFSRIVLARELRLDEIEYICKNSTVEIEVFIHGALCISYSGQCLFSSIVGGRSGNRGRCASPCRLPYTFNDKKGYLLSPKDLCGLEYIEKLSEIGVVSLKIEGRLKSPEYVATVTKIYRNRIDAGNSNNIDNDTNDLAQIFNRGGFSSGYLLNKPMDFIFPIKPNHLGLPLGKILSYNGNKGYCKIKLENSLAISDSVQVETEENNYNVSELMQNGKNVKEAKIGDTVEIGRLKGNISVRKYGL